MPHLTIEYSTNLTDFPEEQTFRELNAAVTSSPEILDESDLKTRFMPVARFIIGTAPQDRAFIHAQLRVLSGRGTEAKRDLTCRIADVLRGLAPRPEGMLVQLSVEIVDMDRPSYVKERLV